MEYIYRYRLAITDRQIVKMPKDAKILSLQVKDGSPCIWAMVNPKNSTEEVLFRVYATGEKITDTEKLQFIGTFQLELYGHVYHVFLEKINNYELE